MVTKDITAGITWLISLLNPAAAFIKACKLIDDVVMLSVKNAARIAQFVDTIIDSVADIVRGSVAKIEDVLGQMVPILIGFLASALGLGGIGQTVRENVTALQKPVKQALDFVIKTGLKLARPFIRGLRGKVKAKVAEGRACAESTAAAGTEGINGNTGIGRKSSRQTAADLGARGVDISEDFERSGAGHTLFARTVNRKLTVEIACRREDLASLLSYAEVEAAEPERETLRQKVSARR